MRNYTAIYTGKNKKVNTHRFDAESPEVAINRAKSFDAWPNVVIFDDTFSKIPGYGEMIYMNGQIIKRGCDGPYLTESLSVYDALRTDLAYLSRHLYSKINPLADKPNLVQFVKDICVQINMLSSTCKEEAAKNNEPCRWL